MQRAKIRLYETVIKGRKLWMVAVPKHGGGRERKYFTTRVCAETYLAAKEVEFRNHGTVALALPERLRIQAVQADELLRPYDKSILEAATFFVAHLKLVDASRKTKDVIADFLEARRADGCAPRYFKDLRVRLAKFEQTFGERVIAEIASGDIDDWLRSLGVAPVTRNTSRLRLSVLFDYALKRRWCAENPVTLVAKAKVRDTEIGILEPEQFATLLERASDETLPYWAIGGFAGLRSAELERLDWSDLHFDSGLVEVKARKAKTGARRFVPMQPALQAWLKPYQHRKRGRTVPRGLRLKLEADRTRAGILDWPNNALRHSFASYHLANFSDAAALALQMGHRDQRLLFNFYRELVKPKTAARWWSIMPVPKASQIVALSA
jgi:integrase